MILPLGTLVRDRNPHDASKRDWVGKVIGYDESQVNDLRPLLIAVEWPNGSCSWIVETRLQVVEAVHG